VLVTSPAFPGNSVPDLIAHAKANPGKINFASPGHGTPPHMVGELFKLRAAIDIVHVPYKGTAAGLTDLMSNVVQITFENPSVTVPLVHAKKLKALAVTGETRNAQIPDVPTMIESGLPKFVSMSFTGLLAPAGTPPEIVKKLNAAMNASLAPPEATEMMVKLGVVPRLGSPEDFAAFLAREYQLWQSVARQAHIRIEN
jgi:tripartite-type tricarboxylate transporter receptor subunit TctC